MGVNAAIVTFACQSWLDEPGLVIMRGLLYLAVSRWVVIMKSLLSRGKPLGFVILSATKETHRCVPRFFTTAQNDTRKLIKGNIFTLTRSVKHFPSWKILCQYIQTSNAIPRASKHTSRGRGPGLPGKSCMCVSRIFDIVAGMWCVDYRATLSCVCILTLVKRIHSMGYISRQDHIMYSWIKNEICMKEKWHHIHLST